MENFPTTLIEIVAYLLIALIIYLTMKAVKQGSCNLGFRDDKGKLKKTDN